ncbi:hypothetical protein J6590_078898 [Homalodisca vitripennis]|nr:hypothetical protein J6590_078898 [Homalodisca vitripennis]
MGQTPGFLTVTNRYEPRPDSVEARSDRRRQENPWTDFLLRIYDVKANKSPAATSECVNFPNAESLDL